MQLSWEDWKNWSSLPYLPVFFLETFFAYPGTCEADMPAVPVGSDLLLVFISNVLVTSVSP